MRDAVQAFFLATLGRTIVSAVVGIVIAVFMACVKMIEFIGNCTILIVLTILLFLHTDLKIYCFCSIFVFVVMVFKYKTKQKHRQIVFCKLTIGFYFFSYYWIFTVDFMSWYISDIVYNTLGEIIGGLFYLVGWGVFHLIKND